MKAKFTNKIKQLIYERDKVCILCKLQGQDFHHGYYGMEAIYTKNRNDVNMGVLVCRDCHNLCHSCKRGEGARQKAIDYLLTI